MPPRKNSKRKKVVQQQASSSSSSSEDEREQPQPSSSASSAVSGMEDEKDQKQQQQVSSTPEVPIITTQDTSSSSIQMNTMNGETENHRDENGRNQSEMITEEKEQHIGLNGTCDGNHSNLLNNSGNNGTLSPSEYMRLIKDHFITSWNKNYSPFKWAFHLKSKNKNNPNFESQVIECFLNVTLRNVSPSEIFFKYLNHALMTELISFDAFTKSLYDLMIENESELRKSHETSNTKRIANVWNKPTSWFELLKLFDYHLPLVLEKFSSLNVSNSSTSQDDLGGSSSVDNQGISPNHDDDEDNFLEMDNKKRKREDTLNNVTIDFIDNDEMNNPKRRKFIISSTKEDVSSLYYTARVVIRCLIIILRHLTYSLSQTKLFPETSMTNMFGNMTTKDPHVILNCERSIQILVTQLGNTNFRTFLLLNKYEEKHLWSIFTQVMHKEVIPVLSHVKGKKNENTKLENLLMHLWGAINQFLIFLLSVEKSVPYQAIEFKELQHSRPSKSLQSTLNEKTCFVTSLLIEDEISTKIITRTNIYQTFARFENSRTLKERSFVNYFLDILYTALDKIYDFSQVPMSDHKPGFIVAEKSHKMLIRKSFITSKFPLLLKIWNDTYCDEKDFYDQFFACASTRNLHANYSSNDIDRLSDIKYNNIEKALFMISKFPWLNDKTNQYVLTELINSCLYLKLVSRQNINELISQYTSDVVLDLENNALEIQQNKFSNFLDMRYIATMFKYPRLQAPLIINDFVENSSKDFISEIDFLISHTHFLDFIQLHGYMPQVMEKVFQSMRNIWSNTEENDMDESNRDEKIQANFSLGFSALYIILERFEFKKIKENKDVFFEMMDRYFVEDSPLIHVKEWFKNWFEDRIDSDNHLDIQETGDRIFQELLNLDLQAQTEQASYDMAGLAKIRKEYSPAHLLRVSSYIAQQCFLWYMAQPEELGKRIIPIISTFIEQFGYHTEIGFASGILFTVNQVFSSMEKASDSVFTFIDVLFTTFKDLEKVKESTIGFNISSVILHNIFVDSVHTYYQNNKEPGKKKVPAVIFNYNNPSLQSLLTECYLITGQNVEWQVAMTPLLLMDTIPANSNSLEYRKGEQETVLLPKAKSFGSSSVGVTSSSSSAVVQTWVQQEFENIYRSLTIGGSLTSLNTIGLMKPSMFDSFFTLRRAYRSMGCLNFLKFMIDQIYECLLKEEQEPFDGFRVAEAAAIMFYISAGEDGVETLLQKASTSPEGLFEFILSHHAEQTKQFLENGTFIYSRQRSGSSIQAISNVEYLPMLSSLLAYFSVFVLSLREKVPTSLNSSTIDSRKSDKLVQKFILHLVEEHAEKVVHEDKHYMTHFTLCFMEQISKIPELIHQTQQVLIERPSCFPKFCKIINRTRKEASQSFFFSFGRRAGFSDELVVSFLKEITN
ncbi:hypothetical protein C9374_009802 [Naegleria lovaniensis]|uniref:Uncharacterized protein n=1 Tax=Naegleria lovaniensis TaxID=51637 RepID=A0AA88H1W1_NAELO|nr:uncharacterized protein C9374_009802 [Naegleria lovaniensis]KAG2393225.1 hypothetical protein C9374_009802 [Naegleria lovaniensis]